MHLQPLASRELQCIWYAVHQSSPMSYWIWSQVTVACYEGYCSRIATTRSRIQVFSLHSLSTGLWSYSTINRREHWQMFSLASACIWFTAKLYITTTAWPQTNSCQLSRELTEENELHQRWVSTDFLSNVQIVVVLRAFFMQRKIYVGCEWC